MQVSIPLIPALLPLCLLILLPPSLNFSHPVLLIHFYFVILAHFTLLLLPSFTLLLLLTLHIVGIDTIACTCEFNTFILPASLRNVFEQPARRGIGTRCGINTHSIQILFFAIVATV